MCTVSMPAAALRLSIESCDTLPFPTEAKLSFPGCAFAAATTCASVVAPIEGCTAMRLGEVPTSVTNAKSRATS